MNFICGDTEDNSKELCELAFCQSQGWKWGKAKAYCDKLKLTIPDTLAKRYQWGDRISGFDKELTQTAAITAEGAKWYCPGKIGGEKFLQWFDKRKETFCYFHNLQYDLGNLFGNKLDALDATLVGGRMIRAVWGKKVFVDSFNIWPMSAAKLGAAFQLEKLVTASMATDKDYIFRDVQIIRKAMLFAWKICEQENIPDLSSTLGGLCVKLWKGWGGENCHDSSEISRKGLYGGRVELFKKINEAKKVAWTDINSLYPSVMRGKFPAEMQDFGRKLPAYGVATVTVTVGKEIDFPVLPFRSPEGRIYYPVGKFTGTWTVAEINEAKRSGYKINRIHTAYGSNDYLIPYGPFVDKLYNLRLNCKSAAESLFYKLCMNNLYGRLGTTGVIGRTVYPGGKRQSESIPLPFGDKVLVSYAMPLSEETNWAHAAYVTAYGRLELLKFMRLVGRENMIYCDTDSCIFDCPTGIIPFQIGDKLGEMKLERMCQTCRKNYAYNKNRPKDNCCGKPVPSDYWDSCETFAPKMYKAGGKTKAKGVPQRLADTYIDKGEVSFDLPFKFREAARFYDRKNSKRLSVWRKVTKVNHAKYDKKILRNNKYSPCKITAV